jgi:hypothetical protein
MANKNQNPSFVGKHQNWHINGSIATINILLIRGVGTFSMAFQAKIDECYVKSLGMSYIMMSYEILLNNMWH